MIESHQEIKVFSITERKFIPFYKQKESSPKKAFDFIFSGSMLVLLTEDKKHLEYFEVSHEGDRILPKEYGVITIPPRLNLDRIIKAKNGEVQLCGSDNTVCILSDVNRVTIQKGFGS